MTTAILLVAGTWWATHRTPMESRGPRIPGDEAEHHVTVEVLNGTTIDGLASRVTRQLRQQGIDVVFYGSAGTTEAGSTLIVARRGDMTAAREVRDALGLGTVSSDPQAQLLLDVTVILGRDADSVSLSTRN